MIKPIRNEADYALVLARVEALMDAKPNSDELEVLSTLVELFGNKSRVSEVLNKKRKLTIDMIRNLHNKLNIPFENLLAEYHLVKM